MTMAITIRGHIMISTIVGIITAVFSSSFITSIVDNILNRRANNVDIDHKIMAYADSHIDKLQRQLDDLEEKCNSLDEKLRRQVELNDESIDYINDLIDWIYKVVSDKNSLATRPVPPADIRKRIDAYKK